MTSALQYDDWNQRPDHLAINILVTARQCQLDILWNLIKRPSEHENSQTWQKRLNYSSIE